MLINCAECDKQISDKAPACLYCGAPVSSSGPSGQLPKAAVVSDGKAPAKKTSPVTWLVLILMIVFGLLVIPMASRNANLPLMPVNVQTRPALVGAGLVLRVRNNSDRHLALLVRIENPTTHQEKTFRLDTDPSGFAEVGHREGWTVASGDRIKVSNNDYQTWYGTAP